MSDERKVPRKIFTRDSSQVLKLQHRNPTRKDKPKRISIKFLYSHASVENSNNFCSFEA